MKNERKPLPVYQTESGEGNQAIVEANNPTTEYTMPEEKKQRVSDFLLKGAENARSKETMLRLTGCSSTRELNRLIELERDQGVIILANTKAPGGYFLPDDGEKGREEMRHFVADLRAKGLSTLRAARPAINELRKIDGQQVIEDLELEGVM